MCVMNFIEYEKQKVLSLTASECCFKLFQLTGQINYIMLYSAIEQVNTKELLWKNSEFREL